MKGLEKILSKHTQKRKEQVLGGKRKEKENGTQKHKDSHLQPLEVHIYKTTSGCILNRISKHEQVYNPHLAFTHEHKACKRVVMFSDSYKNKQND